MDTTPDLDFSPQIALSRRALMRRAAIAAAALPAGAALLEGFAGTAAAADSGQIVLNNYPGWIGKNELAAFSKKYPGDKVKMVTNATSSVAEVILQFKSGNFDVLLSDTTDSGQADAAGLLEKLDWSKIPNIKNVSANFRKAYPWGIPTDYGKVGIAYRPDIVGEKITSWHDVWRLAPKFDGRVVFINLERDCLGSTLKYLGYSSNTSRRQADRRGQEGRSEDQAAPAGVPQHERRPGPRQRLDRDRDGLGLRRRAAQAEAAEDRVGRAQGGHARLPRGLQRREGPGQHRGRREVPQLRARSRAVRRLRQHDGHRVRRAVGLRRTSRSTISTSPILKPTPAVLKRVEFDHYLGAKGTQLFDAAWQEVKAS